ncbi:hypothetical protein RBB79_15235 [Tunturiibacter empetritectus]|uniref:Uncharacterized protein n=1 Tax=Tunturiibacter lichenicola TaxID=2051959 RepID=A0A852VH38_9BACT|nr:hypothetical protein [Edaphobacter lichenicola]NYF90967.1 hypothetical protein [Edaphobacter lichenicola]
MQISLPRLSVFPAPVVLAAMLFCIAEGLVAQKSDGGVELHAKSNITAAEVGLPTYPGATLFKKDADNDAAVDMGLTFGDFHFKLMAASYVTNDSPAQVLAFYRKPMSRYGEVLECEHGKPVGALTVTRSGLTCSDDHGGHVQVNDSSSDHELRAGSPLRYRIVGLDKSQPGATHFGLVYLELPKDSDEKKKQ